MGKKMETRLPSVEQKALPHRCRYEDSAYYMDTWHHMDTVLRWSVWGMSVGRDQEAATLTPCCEFKKSSAYRGMNFSRVLSMAGFTKHFLNLPSATYSIISEFRNLSRYRWMVLLSRLKLFASS